jgi:putative DNA primase/helicase
MGEPLDVETQASEIMAMNEIQVALAQNPTESNLALAFVLHSKGKMLYCAELGGWLEWTGSHWRRDKEQKAFNYCVQMARNLYNGGKTVGRASFAAGVERIAQAEPDLRRVVERFDQDKDLIATPGGTVNLRTGVMSPAKPEDMITRCAGVTPAPGAPTRWLEFLNWAFDGNQGTIGFLQEYMGYSLTGHTAAEIFLYLDGPGGNGKGSISSLLSLIGGDYFHAAPGDLLTYSSQKSHPTSMAALLGKRIVVASELPVGGRLDEQRLKALTGGDAIRAHFMRQDEIEFVPEFKLMIAANHRPRLVRPDDAMRRRLRVVSMPKVPDKPDPAFKKTVLPEEAGQIFGWMIEGAKRILARGEKFIVPERVSIASEEYLGSQDTIAQFIEECCNVGHELACPRSEIYVAYSRWTTEVGEKVVLKASDFYDELERKGFRPIKSGGKKSERTFKGIAVPLRVYT